MFPFTTSNSQSHMHSTDKSMDYFQTQVRAVKSDIEYLNTNTDHFISRVSKKNSSVISDEEERKLDLELRAISNIFNEKIRNLRTVLDKIKSENDEMRNQEYTQSLIYESRLSHWQALTASLRKCINKFKDAQIERQRVEKQRSLGILRVEHPDETESQLERRIDMIDDGTLDKEKVRNQKIKEILQNINDLCLMIDELHRIVEASGQTIDKIEVKMASSVASTTKAKQNLEEALRYQIMATRFKRILLTLATLVILFLLGLCAYRLWPSTTGGGKGQNTNQNNNQNNQNQNNTNQNEGNANAFLSKTPT